MRAVILRMSVQAGAGRRAADTQPPQPLRGKPDFFDVALNRFGIRAEFLPQPHRYGVLQMRAPAFDHVVKFARLSCSSARWRFVQRADQFIQPPQAPQPDRGRDRVVGGLRHIDVIVRVDGLLRIGDREAEQSGSRGWRSLRWCSCCGWSPRPPGTDRSQNDRATVPAITSSAASMMARAIISAADRALFGRLCL